MEQITLSEVTNFDRTIGNASASKGSALKSTHKTPLKAAEEHHEEVHHEQPTETVQEVPVVEEKPTEMVEEVPKTEEAAPVEAEPVQATEENTEELLGKRPANEEQREAEEREEAIEPEVIKKVKTDEPEHKEEEVVPSSTAFESL